MEDKELLTAKLLRDISDLCFKTKMEFITVLPSKVPFYGKANDLADAIIRVMADFCQELESEINND
jgi:hypothetical protein